MLAKKRNNMKRSLLLKRRRGPKNTKMMKIYKVRLLSRISQANVRIELRISLKENSEKLRKRSLTLSQKSMNIDIKLIV